MIVGRVKRVVLDAVSTVAKFAEVTDLVG